MVTRPPYPRHLPRQANFYESGPLDRVAHRREDIAAFIAEGDGLTARIVPIWNGQNLVEAQAGEAEDKSGLDPNSGADGIPSPVLLRGDHPILTETECLIFLGVHDDTAHFAADFSHREVPPLEEVGVFQDLRAFGTLIPHATGSVLAYARGLAHWNKRHRFCGVCGSETRSEKSGHERKCVNPDCGASHFPRTDPAVIMLVHDGADRVILGRQAAWPPGMHSVLAGFVEPGESLEDAVAREVFEEVGVRVKNVRYNSSQPWPFPASLMVGFEAEAESDTIAIDETEIESARWYTREELLSSPEDMSFRMPRKDSIARRLLEDWLGEAAEGVKQQAPDLPFPKVKVT